MIDSKFHYDEKHDDIRCVAKRRLQTTLQNLNVNKLNIYYLHRFSYLSDFVLLSGLQDMMDDGLIGCAGISIYTHDELRWILDHQHKVIRAIQLPVNLFNIAQWNKGGLLADAHKCGYRLIARSVFVQGLLNMAISNPFVHKIGAVEPIQQMKKIADVCNISLSQLALSLVLKLRDIDAVIVGVRSLEQLVSNIDSYNSAASLSIPMDEMLAISAKTPEMVGNPGSWKM
jgi:aryl-alcohol dehydrogenase-like predicted oxidoreductase